MISYLESPVYIPSEGSPLARIWIIGDHPNESDVSNKKTLSDANGLLLDQVLSANGLSRSECYLTNLCHYRPLKNEFHRLEGTKELEDGVDEVYDLIKLNQNKIIIALGPHVLKHLTGKYGIGNWRGSVLRNDSCPSHLIIPTFHPSSVTKDYSQYPLFDVDIRKVKRYIDNSYIPPTFNFKIDNITWADVAEYSNSSYLAIDIEGVQDSDIILCVGFSNSKTDAICLNFRDPVQREMIRVLLSSESSKIFHNGNYDVTMLELNSMEIKNYNHDTMIQHHVIQPELPRRLSTLTSIYTDINYYKSEGKEEDDTKGWSSKRSLAELMEYNLKDCVATYWIWQELMPLIEENEDHIRIYNHEIKLAKVTIRMGHNGLLLDTERNNELRNILLKKSEKEEFILRTIIGLDINIRSPKQVPFILYDYYKLPRRTKYNKAKKISTVTTDEDALISLIAYVKGKMALLSPTGKKYAEWKIRLLVVQSIIAMRGIKKLLSSYIDIRTHNGKIKSTYKPAGTESGRLATGNFVDGTGINLATLPRLELED